MDSSPSATAPLLIPINEAARRLGVCPLTIRNLSKRGQLRAVRVAGRVMIPVAEVERIVATGTGAPRAEKAGASS